MILFQLTLLRSSYKLELKRFFKRLNPGLPNPLKATDSAFCQARKKYSADAFVELNQLSVQHFYQSKLVRLWHGFRLLAIDGSTTRLNGVDAPCREFFDPNAAQRGQRCVLARLSHCYDVLNDLSVEATIAPYDVGERTLAWAHIESCATPKTLFVLDSGYPSFWLFSAIVQRGAHFCARVPTGSWTTLLGEFLESDLKQMILDFKPTAKMKGDCQERDLDVQTLKLRAVKVQLENGELEVLLTTLLDFKLWPFELIASLYASRWSVESNYMHMKSRLEIERLSGKSQLAVEQDFHAHILLANLADLFANQAQPIVHTNTQFHKHTHQVNRTQALAEMREVLVELFERRRITSFISGLIQSMAEKPCPIRPGRKYPRHFGPQRIYAFAYKPIS